MIKLNINTAYCDFLKEEPGSENNRTDRKFIYAAFFNGLKKFILREQSFSANVKVTANQSLETAFHKK